MRGFRQALEVWLESVLTVRTCMVTGCRHRNEGPFGVRRTSVALACLLHPDSLAAAASHGRLRRGTLRALTAHLWKAADDGKGDEKQWG